MSGTLYCCNPLQNICLSSIAYGKSKHPKAINIYKKIIFKEGQKYRRDKQTQTHKQDDLRFATDTMDSLVMPPRGGGEGIEALEL